MPSTPGFYPGFYWEILVRKPICGSQKPAVLQWPSAWRHDSILRLSRPGTRRGQKKSGNHHGIPRQWMFLVLKHRKLCHFDIHCHICYISMVYVAANVHMDPWSTAAWGLPRPRRSQWAPINWQLATWFPPQFDSSWTSFLSCENGLKTCMLQDFLGENKDAAQASGSHSRKNFGNKPVYLIRNRLPSFLSPHQPIINSLCHLLEE